MYCYPVLFNIIYLYIFIKKNIMIYNNNIFHTKYYINKKILNLFR